MVRSSFVVAALLVVLSPAAAAAQEGTSPSGQRTISASGIARVAVKPPAKLNESSIQAAVDVADRAAEAKAVRVATTRATSYASTVGVALGPLLTIDEGDFGIFGSLASLDEGDDDGDGVAPFCRERERRVGRRRRLVKRTVCEVPEPRLSIIRLTYAINAS